MAEGSVSNYLQYGNIEHMFRPNELEAFQFVNGFVKEYGKIPAAETLVAHTNQVMIPHKETPEYYLHLMESRYVELKLKQTAHKISELLTVENKNPEEALKQTTASVIEISTKKQRKLVSDFRDAEDVIIPEYIQQYTAETGSRLKLGWPTFDEKTGGLVRGNLLSFIGRPAMGKTWQMLYAAWSGWNEANQKFLETGDPSVLDGASRMFVSMEMPSLEIKQRLAAMQSKVPMDHINHAELTTFGLKKLKEGLSLIKGYGAPFYIVEGNLAAMVEDLWVLARQLNPAAGFIDGGYLLKHPKEKDRFRRAAENAELIKSELCPLCPWVASWQFAKSADKKKKNKKTDEKPGLEDIGYTDAIAQISSDVIGLFETDNVETLKQRVNEIMKGRKGAVGQFITNWDFINMDFSEIVQQKVEELQFL